MSLPIPDLDDKTFEALFEEARELIPRYAPEWTDHNFSDPGITLIDLLAWITEMQIYSLNRVTDKHILKFLSLVNHYPQPPQPACVQVTFKLNPYSQTQILVPRFTQVASEDHLTGEKTVFETDEDLWVTDLELKKAIVESNTNWLDKSVANQEENVFYFALGEDPSPSDKFYLGFDTKTTLPDKEIKLTVHLFKSDLPISGSVPAAIHSPPVSVVDLNWQYWNGFDWRPLSAADDTNALTRDGRIVFTWPTNAFPSRLPATNDRLYWLRAVIAGGSYDNPPRIDTVLLNTVTAIEGRLSGPEQFESKGLPWQEFQLKQTPILVKPLCLEIREPDGQWYEWSEVKDFDASGPQSLHFTLNHVTGVIRFGDGITGRIPPRLASSSRGIRVVQYRAGGGERGNLPAGSINKILQPPLPGITVTNRRPASGGQDAEIIENAKKRARRDLKLVTRSLTTEDFEKLALETPGIRIARVKVLPNYHPEFPAIDMPGAVTVVVVPWTLAGIGKQAPAPSPGFLKTVENYLDARRILTTSLHVCGPIYIEIQIKATIKIDARLGPETIRQAAEIKLSDFLDPVKGGPNANGWQFGRTVFKSEIYQVLQSVSGVTCVEQLLLQAQGCYRRSEDNIVIPRIGLVYAGQFEISVI